MSKKKINNFTKTQLTITLILILIISITGTTYAYFAITLTSNNTITGDAATVSLILDVQKVFPKATSTNNGYMVPQLSTSGSATSPLANAMKNGCVDANNNVICHVYKVFVQNDGGTATEVVDGAISFFGNQQLTTNISTVMPNLKWRLVSSINETTPTNSTLGTNTDHTASSTPDKFVTNVSLATNDSATYYLIIWINEINQDQPIDTGKTFYGVIEFNSSNGTGVTSTFY